MVITSLLKKTLESFLILNSVRRHVIFLGISLNAVQNVHKYLHGLILDNGKTSTAGVSVSFLHGGPSAGPGGLSIPAAASFDDASVPYLPKKGKKSVFFKLQRYSCFTEYYLFWGVVNSSKNFFSCFQGK